MKKNNFTQCWCIIPAAGYGSRMENTVPKQYLKINNKTILEHTVEIFCSSSIVQKIIIPLAKDDQIAPHLPSLKNNEKIQFITGGLKRSESVLAGLKFLESIAKPQDWVLVHDAARPCIQKSEIEVFFNHLKNHSVGGLLGMPVTDTLKQVADGKVLKTVDRQLLWHAQTPQMFRYEKLLNAFLKCIMENIEITDEASAIEYAGENPLMILGKNDNIKMTYPEDLKLIAYYLQR